MPGMANCTTIPTGLIVLIGPPGAGKSRFAEELVRRGVVDSPAVISSDCIATDLSVQEAARAFYIGGAGKQQPCLH